MAKETVICTCKKCGKQFQVTVDGYNRADAERNAQYAEGAYDTCPECYKAEKAAKIDEYIAALNLPEIQGVSEKQISYAKDLRRKKLAAQYGLGNISNVTQIIKNVTENRDTLETQAKEIGKTFEQCIAEIKATPVYGELYIAMTSTSARELIDTLKR